MIKVIGSIEASGLLMVKRVFAYTTESGDSFLAENGQTLDIE